MTSLPGPLAGITVIDASTSYAGPTASMYLGDMGADVIKVERREGDDSRSWGPPFIGDDSAWFLSANRNKRSICLDITSPAGGEALFRLLDAADVLVENLNPAKLRGSNLDPDVVRARCPGLVYCALSGFGLDGPDHAQPGYDLIAQARSGLMSVTGPLDGTPERVSTALTDIVAGTVAAFAVTAALFRRERTGEGELVDISILEAGLALMSPRIAAYLAGEAEPRPSGGTDSVLSVYQSFETADQPIVLAVGNDRMWQRCCDVLGLTSLAEDPELATNAGRRARRAGLIAPIKQVLMTRPAAEWLGRFAAAGVPCQPVQRLSDVVSDPHVLARGMIDEHQHPRTGSFSTVRAPWRLESSGRGRFGIAPALGEHTLDVLRDIGLSEAEIDQLLEDEVIWDVVPATP